jgi:hypothetical protein
MARLGHDPIKTMGHNPRTVGHDLANYFGHDPDLGHDPYKNWINPLYEKRNFIKCIEINSP